MVPSLAPRQAEGLRDWQGGERAGQIGEGAGRIRLLERARISFRSAISGSRRLLVALPLCPDRRTDSADALEIVVFTRATATLVEQGAASRCLGG